MSRLFLVLPLILSACASVNRVETAEGNLQRAIHKNSGFVAHLEISRYPGTDVWEGVWKAQYTQMCGFLYKGHVITAGHIVKEGWTIGSVVATFLKEPKIGYHLELAAVNRKYDIALFRFKTDPPPFKGAEFGDYAEVADGDRVYSIGSPAGIPFSISEGKIIKSVHRYRSLFASDINPADAYLLHDCFSVGGSSGSVVLNTDGKVIGMTTHRHLANALEFPGAVKAVRSIEIERWLQFLK